MAHAGTGVHTVALTSGGGSSRLDLPLLGTSALAPATLGALRHRATEADIVVAHGSRTLPACALALAGTRIPFVYRNIGDPAAWSGSGLRHLRTRWFLSRAAHVVALTGAAAATIEDRYGVAPDKVTVIPSGVRAADHEPANAERRSAARRAFGIDHDTTVVAYVGALSEEKQPELAVEAVAGIDGAHLLIAGDGPLGIEVAARGAALAPGRVHLLGALADPSPVYDAADVLVLPSRTEGMPGVLIEAGIRALPVVATDVGYVRDVVVDGETGVVVPPGDALALALGIEIALDAHEQLGLAGRARCRSQFDLAVVALRWRRVLASLVS